MRGTSTYSSRVCATLGSPGPKLTAGTPSWVNRATSVQPSLATGSPPTVRTKSAVAGSLSIGRAPGAAEGGAEGGGGRFADRRRRAGGAVGRNPLDRREPLLHVGEPLLLVAVRREA